MPYVPRFTYNVPDWQDTHAYVIDDMVDTGSRIYKCIIAGTSGHVGPIGTGSNIIDGTVHWKFISSAVADYHLAVNFNTDTGGSPDDAAFQMLKGTNSFSPTEVLRVRTTNELFVNGVSKGMKPPAYAKFLLKFP